MTDETETRVKSRWASDVAFGLLIAAVGALGAAICLAFVPAGLTVSVAVIFLGAAVALFGGFEHFVSRGR